MIFGVLEMDDEEVPTRISRVFEELGEPPRLDAICLGKKVQSKVWSVKVTLSSSLIPHRLMSNSRKLHRSTMYLWTIFLSLIALM